MSAASQAWLIAFACALGIVRGGGGNSASAGWQPQLMPASMLTHTVRMWTVDSLFQRANFLAEYCEKVGQAKELCLRALSMSEVHAVEEWQHVESLFQFARFQHQFRGDYFAAEDLYQRVLDFDPNHIGALCNYGLLHHTEPNTRWELAEDMYERALEIDSRHCQTLCNYALLQTVRDDGKGHPKFGSMMYEEAMSLAPKAARTEVTPQQERINFEALAAGRLRGGGEGGDREGGRREWEGEGGVVDR